MTRTLETARFVLEVLWYLFLLEALLIALLHATGTLEPFRYVGF